MAYQPYQYPGYQPAPYYPQPVPDQLAQLRQNQMQQPMMQGQQMGQQAAQNTGIIWCQGEEGAKAYLTAPGASVMLMDSEKNTFYIKSSDQSGMPLPLRVFDYTERATNRNPSVAAQVQHDEFVTRKEFEALEEKINSLTAKEPPKGRKSAKDDIQSES